MTPLTSTEMAKSVSGELLVEGHVDITNGDYQQKGIRNHFVQPMLYSLIDWFGGGAPSAFAYNWTSIANSFIVLGSDTTTATTIGRTALVSPIGSSPGTKANAQIGSTGQLANGASIVFTATWLSGTVSGTCGEVGLYLYVATSLSTFGGAMPSQSSNLASRLSNADGDFTSFSINTSHPLNVDWTIQFTFA